MDPALLVATLLESTTDGVLAFDREFRYTTRNAAMEQISGLRREEVLGRHAFTVFPFLLETGEDWYFRQAVAGKSVVANDRPYTVRQTGRQGYFEGQYHPVRDASGAVVGGIALIHDVTASRDLKRQDESLQLHFRILQSMREGVSVTTEDGVIIFTNPAEDAMFGYEPGELLGQHVTVQNAYTKEENERRVAEVIEVLKREGAWTGEWPNRRKDGTSFVTRAQITALTTETQRLFVCVQEDVTDERGAQSALRETAEQLTLALQASHLGSWRWDAATDIVTFSARAAEIFGIPPGPHMTWSAMRDLLHPEDRDRARLAVEAAIAERSDYDVEYRVGRPKGMVWVAAKGRAIYDEDGQTVGMLGVVQDITGRKRAEQALLDETRAMETINRIGQVLAAELDLQKLLQALTDAATEISGAQFGSFFYNVVNERGESYMLYTLSGVDPASFAGFPMPRNTAIFAPTFSGEGIVRSDDITKDPRYGRSAPHYGMPKGHLPVCSYLAVPVLSRTGEVLGALFFGHEQAAVFTARHERILSGIAGQAAIAIDNARLYKQARDAEQEAVKRAELLAEADRRKDEFLAMLAHELRNPLGAITNALHVMALAPPGDPAFNRAREVARRQVGLQTRLVDDLLDVSRVARGKIRLQLEPADLAALVRQAATDQQAAIDAAGLTLEVDLPVEPVHARVDRARLSQVLGNLIDNARKFTPRGGHVWVDLRATATGNAEIRVRDTGAGLDPTVLPYLFTPFAQADRTLDRSQGGLGLGLALVKGLVELHPGGSVRATSSGTDRGTEFLISLPTETGPQAAEPAPAALNVPAAMRVLVIEDIPDVADTLATLLALHGCSVRVASSGSQGVEMAREFRPQVVLCDIGLPAGMSGLDVAQCLRADPATARASLIAVSGYGADEDRRKSREAGFDRHLTKPVQPEKLLAALRGTISEGP